MTTIFWLLWKFLCLNFKYLDKYCHYKLNEKSEELEKYVILSLLYCLKRYLTEKVYSRPLTFLYNKLYDSYPHFKGHFYLQIQLIDQHRHFHLRFCSYFADSLSILAFLGYWKGVLSFGSDQNISVFPDGSRSQLYPKIGYQPK